MRKTFISFVIAIFSLGVVTSAQANSHTLLKLATFEPPKAFIASKILAGWAKKVNQCSAGELNVKMYAGGVLGSPPKQYDIVTSRSCRYFLGCFRIYRRSVSFKLSN